MTLEDLDHLTIPLALLEQADLFHDAHSAPGFLWYGDGDLCADVHGNLAHDVEEELLAGAIVTVLDAAPDLVDLARRALAPPHPTFVAMVLAIRQHRETMTRCNGAQDDEAEQERLWQEAVALGDIAHNAQLAWGRAGCPIPANISTTTAKT